MMALRSVFLCFATIACLSVLSSCMSASDGFIAESKIYGDRAGFSVDAIRSPPTNPRSGVEIPSLSGSDSQSVWIFTSLYACADCSSWWITITVGTPPQPLTIMIDTGTVDLSLMSTFINPAQRGLAPVYDPNRSSTAVLLNGYTWWQQYAGSAPNMGYVVQDTVRVGSIYLMNFTFEVDNVTALPHITGPPYGNLGLDPDPNGQPTSPKRMPGWLQTVMKWVYGQYLLN